MDRKQLKAQSKNLIRTAQPKPVVTAIIRDHISSHHLGARLPIV